MRFPRTDRTNDATKAPLTSFVDIVFLLLIFFVMTFHVVPAEGDFDIEYSEGGDGVELRPTVTIRIRPETESTNATKITWQEGFHEEQPVRDMGALNARAWLFLRGDDNDMLDQTRDAEAILDVDPSLAYRHTIDAMSALSARRHNGQRTELFRGISLARRKNAQQ